ncbi:MAG TPA: hypothetical protein VFA07_16490 [Chthonomonadaceae bacterium]|nr:hypothetical protein [Chthonomonadaceae bacterium]
MTRQDQTGQLIEKKRLWPALFWWAVFAAAFGCIEAAVVVYIRRLAGMPPGMDYRQIWTARGLSFHSISILTELRRQGILGVELTREIATLTLLFSAACAAGRSRIEKAAIFGYTFALWDLTYYLYLAFWIGFPRSLLDTDIYFLILTASYGPIWLPALVLMPALLALSVGLMRKAGASQPLPGVENPCL